MILDSVDFDDQDMWEAVLSMLAGFAVGAYGTYLLLNNTALGNSVGATPPVTAAAAPANPTF